jgi:hypothetical protein
MRRIDRTEFAPAVRIVSDARIKRRSRTVMRGSPLPVLIAISATLAAYSAPCASLAKEQSLGQHFPIVELRQYTLRDGQRDTLINLFERKFIEPQEAIGMKVIGTFTDLDRPNRLVWIRGFTDMAARAEGLNAFYFGPVWKAHREEANSTMLDSDNVLLLHAPGGGAEFDTKGERPALGQTVPAGLVVATIYYLNVPPSDVQSLFEVKVKRRLERLKIPLLAWFVPETAKNNFPRLPVREGEQVLVWFTRFDNEADHSAHRAALTNAAAPLARWFSRPPEVLRLRPTSRSLIRGTSTGKAALSPAGMAGSAGMAIDGEWGVDSGLQ